MICAIKGCGNDSHCKGLCVSHYRRMRNHGDPNKGRVPAGTLLGWVEENKTTNQEECLIWPFSCDQCGYARIRYKGKQILTHQLMCEFKNGPRPSDKFFVRHSCGQGSKGCVNPNHLSWGTQLENEADKVKHGTRARGNKHGKSVLTEEQVLSIKRQILENQNLTEIAKKYNVCKTTISKIKRGLVWSWLNLEASND